MLDWSGKNVVCVGGFGGVGYQMCRMLMKKKISHLLICERMENVEMLRKLQAENSAVKVMYVNMNIMDRTNMEQAVKQMMGVIKQIDVLVNGAGVLLETDVETTIGVNLTGLINMTMMCMPYMDKMQMGQGGMVVNMASVYGMEPAPAFPVYAAAKHGVMGFTRSMADEHHHQPTGVTFICICPGLTTTETMMNLRDKIAMGHQQNVGDWIDTIGKAKHQTPEDCAMNMVKAMEMMKNGGLYICSMGQLKEMVPTVYWHM